MFRHNRLLLRQYLHRQLRQERRRRQRRRWNYPASLILLLILLLIGTLCMQLVLHFRFPSMEQNEVALRMTTTTTTHSIAGVANIKQQQLQQKLQLLSCNDLFGSHQIIRKGPCIYHKVLHWSSCNIGNIRIDTTKIDGSLGGEPIHQVYHRPEVEEKLTFHNGSLIILLESSSKKLPFKKEDIIPIPFQQSMDAKLGGFLSSAVVVEVVNENDNNNVNETYIASDTSSTSNDTTTTTATTNLLVRRGNYANPCMALLTMYNVYIVMTYFNITTDTLEDIIWLDGHAKGDLDPVWTHLFQKTPIHIKQLSSSSSSSLQSQQSSTPQKNNTAIVVNTMSAIGDEGYGRYDWNSNSTCDSEHSTLIAFRDFVLDRYGISRKRRIPQQTQDDNKQLLLTLLVRKDYTAHPRSNGRTDRTLANVTADVEYLQGIYPDYTIHVVSFEGMPFPQQLEIVTQTDIFVSVHGAGNIHVLFLPDHATIVEYYPKGFERRRRFRYLAACLGNGNSNNENGSDDNDNPNSSIRYIAKVAWKVHKFPDGKMTVRLHPESEREEQAASDIRL